MFLITTADQRFWKPDEKYLFLGEWCLLYGNNISFDKQKDEILPYHWDNRSKLYADYQYLAKVYCKHLGILAGLLNKLHGVEYSLRFWQIVIGQWLHYFVEILYDRYSSIKSAEESGKVHEVWLAERTVEACIPTDHISFHHAFIEDEYNVYLYGEIIRHLNTFAFKEVKAAHLSMPWHKSAPVKNKVKAVLKNIVGNVFYMVPDSFNRNVFVKSYYDKADLIKIQLSLGQMPYLYVPEANIKRTSVDLGARKQIEYDTPEDQFQQILSRIIPYQIPLVHVEMFGQLRAKALKSYPKQPQTIITANAHTCHEAFKLWAGHCIERGSKFVISQHGGNYGMSLWNSEEDHELNIADVFLSWGWTSDNDKIQPLASGKLRKACKEITPNNTGKILWVQMGIPRYSYLMYSIPVSSQWLNYHADQISFAQNLDDDVRKEIVLRLYPVDYSWHQKERWQANFPNLAISDNSEPFLRQLCECRLFVGTYNATTYLETLAANFPTLIFWDPHYWELRKEVEPYFSELKSAGIFHDNPVSAAKKLNTISGDVGAWWASDSVQNARARFVDKFARTDINDIALMIDKIKKLAR